MRTKISSIVAALIFVLIYHIESIKEFFYITFFLVLDEKGFTHMIHSNKQHFQLRFFAVVENNI